MSCRQEPGWFKLDPKRQWSEDLVFNKPLTSANDHRFEALSAIYRNSIALREQKSQAELATMVSRAAYRFLLAEEGGHVVGFSISFLATAEPFCLLEYMAVDKPYRGCGVGSELFRQTANAVREQVGTIPIVLEVDSGRGSAPDQDVIRHRHNFYRRLGCRRIADCSYILPLPGASPAPGMDLFVHLTEPAPAIRRSTLHRWLEVIYRDVYGCSAGDPRIAMMLHRLPDPIQLV